LSSKYRNVFPPDLWQLFVFFKANANIKKLWKVFVQEIVNEQMFIKFAVNLCIKDMKIAVPSTSTNTVDAHFGHCEFYTIFTINDQNTPIHRETLASPQGCGCKSNIASVLKEKGISLMLAGNIGQGAINVLNNHGINVIRGCQGEVSQVVERYLANQLTDSGITCSHHDHNHTCEH
jgi:predicted Fe-Mo cluster-binding NifX family protein